MIHHPDVSRLHEALQRDSAHEIAAALILNSTGDGFAYATVEGVTGLVLAWDGFYFGDDIDSSAQALADVEWSDWDDMPSKLLIISTAEWAHKMMRFWLLPTFSVARQAAELVSSHAGELTTPDAARGLSGGRVIAYIPVVDQDVYQVHLRS